MTQEYIKIKELEIPINIKNYKNSKSIKIYFKGNVLNITKPTKLSKKIMMEVKFFRIFLMAKIIRETLNLLLFNFRIIYYFHSSLTIYQLLYNLEYISQLTYKNHYYDIYISYDIIHELLLHQLYLLATL